MSGYDLAAAAAAESDRESVEELAEFLGSQLSRPLPADLIEALFEVQTESRTLQTSPTRRLEREEISREEYLEKFNAALAESMRKNRALLGDEDFAHAFGARGLKPDLVDPAIFFSSRGAA